MTTTYQTPAPLAAYLRRATFGLTPERREEVWNEIEEHVLCRAEQLEFQGLMPDKALDTALRELGPPLRVSAAMNGVHNMPKLIAFATLTTLAVSAGLYALAQKQPPTLEVSVQTQVSGLKCIREGEKPPQLPLLFSTKTGAKCFQDDTQKRRGTYMTVNDLTQKLDSIHIKTEINPESGTVNFFYSPLHKQVAQTYIVYKDAENSFVDVGDLFSMVIWGFPIPTHVTNFSRPEIVVDKMSVFALASHQTGAGQQVYRTLAEQVAYKLFDFSTQGRYFSYQIGQPLASATMQTIQTGLPSGEVVAAYQYLGATPAYDAQSGKRYVNELSVEVGVVDERGQVRLRVPVTETKFVTAAPKEPETHTVMLVRLSNIPLQDLKSGIFLPKQ